MQRWKKQCLVVVLAGILLLAGGGCARREADTAEFRAGETGLFLMDAEVQTEESAEAAAAGTEESVRNTETQQPDMALVYVCGAVRQPGVYELPEGSRIYEAIQAAGGFAETADMEWLNQAEVVCDGQKLCVFTKEETAQMESEAGSGVFGYGDAISGQNGGKINLNTASREELMTLPGIGEAKADAILQYRTEHGGFGSIEEIQQISGIKTAVFSKIKDQITVT